MRKYLVALVATAALLVLGGVASAAFPNFTGCQREAPNFAICIDVQNTSGNLNIKGFNVPLGPSLEIRGAITTPETGFQFIPARGTNGFIGQPVRVPGGLIGIEWLPGNSVLAITELAGPSSGIRFDLFRFGLTVPVKVRLVNILLGMDCHIGTNRNPVVLNLITGTTNPPPPNRPITGQQGRINEDGTVTENVNVENSFAVPGATECGLGLGLINSLVNLKLRLPSAAGNNSIVVTNNIAFAE
ncbi:MAG: hypothetical protein WBD55_13105 [Dehalococcoidia bacterium]